MTAVFLPMLDPFWIELATKIAELSLVGLGLGLIARAVPTRFVWGTAIAVGLAGTLAVYDCSGCWWCMECW